MAQEQDSQRSESFLFRDPLPVHSLCPSAPLPHHRPRITRPLSTPHYSNAELSYQNCPFDEHCAQTMHRSCHLVETLHHSFRPPFDSPETHQPLTCFSDQRGRNSESDSHSGLATQVSASQSEAIEGPVPVASEGMLEFQQLLSPRAVGSSQGAEFQQPMRPRPDLLQRSIHHETGARRFPERPAGSQTSYQPIVSATRDSLPTPFLRTLSHDGYSHTAGRSSDDEERLFEQDRVRARRLLMGLREWLIVPGSIRFGPHGSRTSRQVMSGSSFPRLSPTSAGMDQQRIPIVGEDGWTNKVSALDVSAATITLEWGCGICLEEFSLGEEGVVVIDVCRHFFHHACLAAWFGESTTCPFCRANVN